MIHAAGLDLSLTATGYADSDGDGGTFTTKTRGMERLATIRTFAVSFAVASDLVAIEGYSYGSKFSHSHALGELGGVIRLALWELGTDYVDVPPAVLKKWATGKGNANKDAVLAAAIRHGYLGDDNNGADAYWLADIASWMLNEHEAPTQIKRALLAELTITTGRP